MVCRIRIIQDCARRFISRRRVAMEILSELWEKEEFAYCEKKLKMIEIRHNRSDYDEFDGVVDGQFR